MVYNTLVRDQQIVSSILFNHTYPLNLSQKPKNLS
jgi:hypothetical protein